MKVLVLNSGSSSLKFQLFDMGREVSLGSGLIEKIAEAKGYGKFQEIEIEEEVQDHSRALFLVDLMLKKSGLIKSLKDIDAVGHRVVHGGEYFNQPTLITKEVAKKIEELSTLAPLHNPANYAGIKSILDSSPNIPQVAVFDTAFHQSIPPKAFMYALPFRMYEDLKIRRYGFHGTSHHFIAKESAKFLKRDLNSLNMITLHLGSGASVCAIENGVSVDTSMGFTPLEGLMMGTRSGDLDPEILLYLERKGMSIEELDKILNKESGLKGIAGVNDLRTIFKLSKQGDKRASLAIEMFAYHIKKYLGAYYAVLGRVDTIAFTGGIGEHASFIREKVCENLSSLGIELDLEENNIDNNQIREISKENKSIKILVVPTNEELEIALQTKEVIGS